MDRRALLLSGIDLAQTVGAEIGPQDKPLVRKEDARILYVDHCDTEELRRRFAGEASVDISRLQVDAVWGERTLREALLVAFGNDPADTSSFLDYVLASHVIEHVPDFLGWLGEVHATLRPSGEQRGVLRLAVPDKRYCFDLLRTPTVVVDVLEAYALRRRRPSAQRILDFALNMAHVDLHKAWSGELDHETLVKPYTLDGALSLARDAEFNGNYHDVHCWVFTPASFVELCLQLAQHGLMQFECEWLVDTPRHTLEFYVSLRPGLTQQAVLDSWRKAREDLLAVAAATSAATELPAQEAGTTADAPATAVSGA
jgi:SAM-dependent methyltransferase